MLVNMKGDSTNMENEVQTLATELLHELKASAKRWFIIAVIELIVILAMASGFVWYLSLPVEEEVVTVESDDNGNANYIGNDVTGAIYNGESSSKESTQGEKR